jgi:7-alpha-hydroxysteroid dehydrogenase
MTGVLERFRVDGKVAIVTGAGRGIGAGCALALAEAGADVVLASRTEEQLRAVAEEVEALGRRAVVAPIDVNDDAATIGLVERAVSELGGVDIVVNNAGGTMPRPFLDTSPGYLERAFHFNVTTAFVLTKAAVPAMLERGEGAVVNISSAMGRMADRGMLAYGTAKAGLAHLTRLAAADLAPRIRVNAIAVGSVATSALEIVTGDDGMRAAMEEATPVKRLGEVEDIAAACLWLASPAGSFVTGKVIEVDGGLQAPNLPLGLPDL